MELSVSSKLLLFTIISLCQSSQNRQRRAAKTTKIHFEKETLLQNVRQLTFVTIDQEYCSKDGKSVAYDGSGSLKYGTKCVQLYQLDLKLPYKRAFRLSSGLGVSRASSFYPNATGLVYSDSFRHSPNRFYGSKSSMACQVSKCKSRVVDNDPIFEDICRNSSNLYDLNPHLDIFHINPWGNFRAQLTNGEVYNSEAKISPDGKSIVFTSMKSGHPELWTMSALDGSCKKKLTHSLGYKGGASFSPDGSKIIFHAVLPRSVKEVQQFNKLLHYDLVELSKAEVFVMNMDGSDLRQVTNLEALSWTPTFLDNYKIVFSSNHNSSNRKEHSNLYTVNLDGSGLKQITFNRDGRDLFPTVDYLQERLMWSSTRNSSKTTLNLFIADLKSVRKNEESIEEFPNSSKDFLQMLVKAEQKNLDQTELREGKLEDTHFEGEKHLANLRQLTFGGQNAEGYFRTPSISSLLRKAKATLNTMGSFSTNTCLASWTRQSSIGNARRTWQKMIDASFDDQSIVLQAAGIDRYGTECDQIYRADFTNGLPTPSTLLQRLSTGNTSYTWDLFPGYDIYKVNEYGNFVARLTESLGYDAEGAVSPDGSKIVFTSMRSGDPELYLMDADGGNQKQLTNGILGYDGGPFFSPDGSKVIFRASRPSTAEEIKKYKQLLSYNLVEPLAMELHVINVDGTGLRRITNLGGSNWAPFYLSDNHHIIFSSNFNATGHFGAFDLYSIGEDGKGVQRVTYNQNGFDAFPMMSYTGRQLVWGSSRNGKTRMELNLFLADWIN